MVTLRFFGGTIELSGLRDSAPELSPVYPWDPRTACHRVPAIAYADLLRTLVRQKVEVDDQARQYATLAHGALVHRQARPYQAEALAAWLAQRGRGIVVLPTGAGKSLVACLAIEAKKRATLVVAPTLDLCRQWYDLLRTTFGVAVGVIGGGQYDVQPLTVSTYDSAYLHMEHLGARFGDLAGDYLAEYDTERVSIELAPAERAEYEAERAVYRGFVEQHGIRMASPKGWTEFIRKSCGSDAGRRAMRAYRRQRELALCAPAKLEYVEHLLDRHRAGAAILFTQDNATCYAVSRRFLVPAITHQTKVRERSQILRLFREGVDIPEANVAIVISGSGSTREHVQRLGRILRKRDGKRAVLYELVTADTSETFTSDRRREHDAYR